MNILLIILLSLVSLIVLLLLVALVAKKEYNIKREVIIRKPLHDVFHFLKHLKNQDLYNVWAMKDPNLKKDYRGAEDGYVGFVYAWEGNKEAGKGEQEIVELREGEKVDIEVRFEKPFKSVARTPFTTEAVSENETRVTWHMVSRMKYPMNLMLLFLNMETMLGKDMETSLGRIKTILEK